jgi:hypothetical protein
MDRRIPASILVLGLTLGACHHRAPVTVEQDGGPEPLPDLFVRPDGPLLPDAPIPPSDAFILPPADLGPPQICQPLGRVPASRYSDPRGNFTLGFASLPTSLQSVIKVGADAKTSAAAFNRPGMAALAVTRPSLNKDPHNELAQVRMRLTTAAILAGHQATKVVVRASGISGKSHEGFPDVKEAIWDVDLVKPMDPAKLRDLLLAGALQLQNTSALVNLPAGNVSWASTQLMVRVGLVVRPGQVALVAAVANRADYDHKASDLFRHVDDASNGTSLAQAGRQLAFVCDQAVVSSVPRADIIWIIDESGSTSDNRKDIVNNANLFFAKALSAGLDFRMGVAGMKKEGPGVELGKFCSAISTKSSHDGGTDRFLLPGEQAIFSSCIKNPPYYEGGAEYGLTHGYWSVKRHLPRMSNWPNRIRTDAKLTVIFVTDEVPQGFKSGSSVVGPGGILSTSDYKACTLSSSKQGFVAKGIKPLMDLFKGSADPGGDATVHLIGGTCGNSCNAEVAHGYRELAQALGGQVGDICQSNLGATLQVIIDSIVAGASPQKLKYSPVSSTLAVAVAGKRLKRSRSAGFQYNAASNTLSFVNVKVTKGQALVASYHRFQ